MTITYLVQWTNPSGQRKTKMFVGLPERAEREAIAYARKNDMRKPCVIKVTQETIVSWESTADNTGVAERHNTLDKKFGRIFAN